MATRFGRVQRLLPEVMRQYPLIPKLLWNYLRLASGKPLLRSVDFMSTHACQLRCEHCCAQPLMHNKAEAPMSTLECKSTIDQSLALGAIAINFAGGEPLCDDRIYELIAYVPPWRAIAVLTTNGFDLDGNAVQRLKRAGLKYLAVSLDFADAARHDKFRRRSGVYERARAGIEAAHAAGLGVIINTTATEETLTDGTVTELVAYATSIGAFITLMTAKAVGNWEHRGEGPLSAAAQRRFDELHRLPHVRWDGTTNYWQEGCAAGIEKIAITASGDVLPCQLVQVTFGNVKREPLETIWRRMIGRPEFARTQSGCIADGGPDFAARQYMGRIKESQVRPVPADLVFPLSPPS